MIAPLAIIIAIRMIVLMVYSRLVLLIVRILKPAVCMYLELHPCEAVPLTACWIAVLGKRAI